jgi:uncharacterized protein YjhX (UPF0386 family)
LIIINYSPLIIKLLMSSMKLSKAEQQVLQALAQGATLKAHRTMDGAKVHKLHPLGGEPLEGMAEVVSEAVVTSLKGQGLIESNMKFPAATYLLTDKGVRVTATLTDGLTKRTGIPLGPRKYSSD